MEKVRLLPTNKTLMGADAVGAITLVGLTVAAVVGVGWLIPAGGVDALQAANTKKTTETKKACINCLL